ncbi:MAG TPA: hypothetical protein DCM45_01975 [Clostridiales bacterium]|nr:hypothetical protein [Clostridiales bacterium]
MAGIFGFFDYTKEGKGVYPDEPPKGPIATFFAVLGRKFWKIVQINLMYILFSLVSVIVSILAASLMLNWIFPGMTIEAIAKLLESTGIVLTEGHAFVEYAASQLVIIYIILGFLLTGLSLIITGPVHAGFTYILRNYSREEHAFIWMDFKEHLAKNFKQSLLSGLISFIVTVVILFNFAFYLNTEINLGIFRTLLLSIITIILLIWSIMQMYVYPMMVTFQLTLKQIYKNSLLFSIMRLPVNVALLIVSILLVFGIPLILFMIGTNITFFIAIVYYLFLAFGVNLLMTNFFVYRGIDKYMIQKIKAAEEMNEEDAAESPADEQASQTESDSEEDQPAKEDENGPLTEVPVGAK